MNAQPRLEKLGRSHPRPGFTLVEILITIVIISLLMAIAIPAITIAINRGKTVAMKLEVDSIKNSINEYEARYGDYPPDFSSWAVIQRHYRKIFPRIGTGELNRLRLLLDVDPSNDTDTTFPSPFPAHDATLMDRAEVLVFVLGGYSDNPIAPFTGPGGPLEEIDTANTMSVTFQMNVDRPNRLFDFDQTKLDIVPSNSSSPLTATNRRVSSDTDLFANYAATKDGAPYVYFDSRTYTLFDAIVGDFNGYSGFGVVRPYYSTNANPNATGADYATAAAALAAWDFMNPDTFQVIAPGLDSSFGAVAAYDFDTGTTGLEPVYFQYPSGNAIAPSLNEDSPGDLIITGVNGYQERSTFDATENFQLDNVTDFSSGKIVDDVQ